MIAHFLRGGKATNKTGNGRGGLGEVKAVITVHTRERKQLRFLRDKRKTHSLKKKTVSDGAR